MRNLKTEKTWFSEKKCEYSRHCMYCTSRHNSRFAYITDSSSILEENLFVEVLGNKVRPVTAAVFWGKKYYLKNIHHFVHALATLL